MNLRLRAMASEGMATNDGAIKLGNAVVNVSS